MWQGYMQKQARFRDVNQSNHRHASLNAVASVQRLVDIHIPHPCPTYLTSYATTPNPKAGVGVQR